MARLVLHPLRRSLIIGLLGLPISALALNSATITTSIASPDCLGYRVVGACYWLFCTNFGYSVRTSPKIRHYVPDAVVSSYANTGEKARSCYPQLPDGYRCGRSPDGRSRNALRSGGQFTYIR